MICLVKKMTKRVRDSKLIAERFWCNILDYSFIDICAVASSQNPMATTEKAKAYKISPGYPSNIRNIIMRR